MVAKMEETMADSKADMMADQTERSKVAVTAESWVGEKAGSLADE